MTYRTDFQSWLYVLSKSYNLFDLSLTASLVFTVPKERFGIIIGVRTMTIHCKNIKCKFIIHNLYLKKHI